MPSKTRSRTPVKARRTREDFVRDYARLIEFMTREDLHEDTRREILYQAICMYSGKNGYFDHSDRTWISEDAERHCHSSGRARVARTTVREHVVPIGVSIEPLWRAHKIDAVELQKALDDASLLCIVSNDDNSRLNAAGLKTKLPPGTPVPNMNPWVRYDHPSVGIRRRPLAQGSKWSDVPSGTK